MSVVAILPARLMFKDDTFASRAFRDKFKSVIFRLRLVRLMLIEETFLVKFTSVPFMELTLALKLVRLMLRSETL